MGKHKKIVNNDPILQRDYKYEKRKKERAEEREAQKERDLQEQKAKQELEEIKNQVEDEIEREISNKVNEYKRKKITKVNKDMFTKSTIKKNEITPSTIINKESLILKTINHEHLPNFYTLHYQELPTSINLAREQYQTRKQIIDRQVKDQIKQMFSIAESGSKKVDFEQANNDNSKIISEEDEFNSPYILIRSGQRDKDVVINAKEIYSLTPEAYESKDMLVSIGEHQDFKQSAIQSYFDYIHIENPNDSTQIEQEGNEVMTPLEEFRGLVIKHMMNHEACCKNDPSSKGFTNAKSVILCPYVHDAQSIIEEIETHFEGYEQDKKNLEEFEENEDFFRIGLRFNHVKKIIQYSSKPYDFKGCHIIIASPVGIKAIVAGEGESERDNSFLSSVEILYIDQANVISMQNWDHLVEVLKVINLMPKAENITNSINSFRPFVPELKGKIYRQSIIFSEFNFPEINSLKNFHFHNWQGCITRKIFYQPELVEKQHNFDIQFYKMDLKQPREDLELRFEFFKRKFWDEIHNNDSMKKVVIFTRSYFEYVKIKEFLTNVNASVSCISEYSKKTKKGNVQSRIASFNANKNRILLLTERAYYYGICQIKKFQHIYFYSFPRNSSIYFELLKEVIKEQTYTKNKIVGIYTKYDIMTIERLVGSKKAIEMVKEYCSNVSFVI